MDPFWEGLIGGLAAAFFSFVLFIVLRVFIYIDRDMKDRRVSLARKLDMLAKKIYLNDGKDLINIFIICWFVYFVIIFVIRQDPSWVGIAANWLDQLVNMLFDAKP